MHLYISVAASGKTFSNEEKAAIFQETQVVKGLTHSQRQTYKQHLSLHISKLICKQLGGDLDFNTGAEDGGQTTFVFHVTCRTPDMEQICFTPSQRCSDPISAVNMRILIISQNVMDKITIKNQLKNLGLQCRVQTTSNNLKAREIVLESMLADSQFSIVIFTKVKDRVDERRENLKQFKQSCFVGDHYVLRTKFVCLRSKSSSRRQQPSQSQNIGS